MIDKETGEVVTPFIRTPYNYNTDEVSEKTGLDCSHEPTRTQQQFKDEVDINTIVERFNATGEMPPAMNFPTEQDFTDTFDFQSAMNVTITAREEFMKMSAKHRARFHNDPQEFMEFIHNAENFEEAVKMKMIIKKEPEEPTVKETVNAPKEPVNKEKEKKE